MTATQHKPRHFFYGDNCLLDPDFDNFGGELQLSQIRDPGLPLSECWNTPGAGDPLWYLARQREYNAIKRERLRRVSERFLLAQTMTYPRPRRGFVYKCCGCVAYNGHHTVNYWNTGQKDCW